MSAAKEDGLAARAKVFFVATQKAKWLRYILLLEESTVLDELKTTREEQHAFRA